MIARSKFLMAIWSLLFSATLLFAASVGDGAWKSKVPDKDRARENPYDTQAMAIAAGAKLFRQNCSACHGSEATGTASKPSLHTDRVRTATPGELEWLLKNGSMKNGMPSWSPLPEQQRWQIVSYLKSFF